MALFRSESKWLITFPTLTPAPVPTNEPPVVAPEALCRNCTRSHVLRGFEPGTDAVFCHLTGSPWFVPFPVKECSEFESRRGPRAGTGFANAAGKEDVSERNDCRP